MSFRILHNVFLRQNSVNQCVVLCLQSPVLCFLFPAVSRCHSCTLISLPSDLITTRPRCPARGVCFLSLFVLTEETIRDPSDQIEPAQCLNPLQVRLLTATHLVSFFSAPLVTIRWLMVQQDRSCCRGGGFCAPIGQKVPDDWSLTDDDDDHFPRLVPSTPAPHLRALSILTTSSSTGKCLPLWEPIRDDLSVSRMLETRQSVFL